MCPPYLQEMFTYSQHGYLPKLVTPSCNLAIGRRSFSFAAPRLYNLLPGHMKSASDIDIFKKKLKTYLFPMTDYEIKKLWL